MLNNHGYSGLDPGQRGQGDVGGQKTVESTPRWEREDPMKGRGLSNVSLGGEGQKEKRVQDECRSRLCGELSGAKDPTKS